MSEDIGRLIDAIFERAAGRARYLVAVAGPPGAGKSTLADGLREAIAARGETAEVLPMDGFHMDDSVLRRMGRLASKGAPDTFDVRGFLDIVRAIRKADEDVLVPVFDRSREIAIAAARLIPARTRFVIVEGNYLLLAQQPWTALDGQFDFSVMISPPVAVLDERLMRRWRSYGLDEDSARAKTSGNDLKNGEQVRNGSREADWILIS